METLLVLIGLAIPSALQAEESVPYIYPEKIALQAPLNPAFTDRVALEAQKPPEFKPKQYLLGLSAEYGFSYPLAQRILQCESRWVSTAKNPKSTAFGYGQFLDSTWENTQKRMGVELDRYDPKDQLEAFAWLLSEDSVIHWEASRHCWQKWYNATL